MFGDIEGIEKLEVSQENLDNGVIECYVEDRSEDWYITYYVYEDKVEVIESMGMNYEHCKKTVETLDEAIAIAGKWC